MYEILQNLKFIIYCNNIKINLYNFFFAGWSCPDEKSFYENVVLGFMNPVLYNKYRDGRLCWGYLISGGCEKSWTSKLDPIGKIPEFKYCAAKMEKIDKIQNTFK